MNGTMAEALPQGGMRAWRLAVPLMFVLGLGACESVTSLSMPSVAEIDDPSNAPAQQANIGSLTDVIRRNPNDPQAYNTRGVAFARSGRFGEAVTDFTRAIQLNPDYAAAYTNRGLAHRQAGRNAEALGDFNRAIQADGRYYPAYLARGNLSRVQGNLGQAISDLG
ncbi:MAG: tetratricopeptide repeat protein, partial [Beijerinckiaceae bacterium]|nr:tetratricopeptide repeat protein [Beijerinckiaceae bacterium]